MSSQLASSMRATTTTFLQGWEAWKTEPIMSVRAPECVMHQRPASLQIPERNNEQFRAWFTNVEGLLENCKITTHDYFSSIEERRAWVHCSATADNVKSGGVYENEYMFVLSFDESGEKITRIVEMVDSQRVRETWAKSDEVEFKRN